MPDFADVVRIGSAVLVVFCDPDETPPSRERAPDEEPPSNEGASD